MHKERLKKLEADLWSAADKLRTNSDLKSSEYSTPVVRLMVTINLPESYDQCCSARNATTCFI